MLKKFIKSIIIITIIFIIIFSGNIMIALATTQSDLDDIQDKIDDTGDKIDEVQDEIDDVQDKISDTMEKVQELNSKIAGYEAEISDLNTEIEEVTEQITEAEEQLKEAEEEYENQEILLQKRLVALYESGDTTYLDVLLSSSSITDFITKYYIVSEIAENDKNLLEQMEKNKISIEETKELLETSKEQIEALKTSKENTADSLKASQSVQQSYIDELSEEEKELQEELEKMQKEEEKLKKELEEKEKQYQSQISNLSGDGTFQKPITGGTITATMYYSSGKYHGALDYGVPIGTQVYAASEGVVLYCGWSDGGYGYRVVLQHANRIENILCTRKWNILCFRRDDSFKRSINYVKW